MSNKERKDNSFIKKPIYPGGLAAYKQFLKENLKYPEIAKSEGIEGKVHLKYTINHKGLVTEAQVTKGIGFGCDEEALRIIKMLKFEVPKNPRKLRVTFHQKTSITFKIPKSQPKAPPQMPAKAAPQSHPSARPKPMQIGNTVFTYQVTKTKKTPKDTPKPKKSYGYTIERR